MAEEETVSSQLVYQGRAVRLRIEKVRISSGRETTREIVEHDNCVAVVAVDADGKLLLVKQFRKAVGKELLEIPAGGIDSGESPEEAVSREMREETGYLPRKVERLGGFYSAPGYATEYLYLYLATALVPSQLFAEDTEGISLVRISSEQIPDLISSGSICDAKSIAGLLVYLDYEKTH